MTMKRGTTEYMAPELRYSTQYGTKVDVYSFGVILWSLVKGKQPDFGGNVVNTLRLAFEQPDKMIPWLLENLKDDNLSVFLEELIVRCIKLNPNERPSFNEIQVYLSVENFEDTNL